jgi:alpha 1,6-mannosyltransferase
MLRYLVLYLEGGIYTDTDTTLLKSPTAWGRDAQLWRDGAGWLEPAEIDRIAEGENAEDVLGPPSVIVGIEADVGNRADWNDWWPRPVSVASIFNSRSCQIQVVQWTMASAPGHPINLGALLRILHSTCDAILWARKHGKDIMWLTDNGRFEESQKKQEVDVLAEPRAGGPLGVMAWTGPGVWTDAVLSYLRVKYGVMWTDLRNLDAPLRVGDVVILPGRLNGLRPVKWLMISDWIFAWSWPVRRPTVSS